MTTLCIRSSNQSQTGCRTAKRAGRFLDQFVLGPLLKSGWTLRIQDDPNFPNIVYRRGASGLGRDLFCAERDLRTNDCSCHARVCSRRAAEQYDISEASTRGLLISRPSRRDWRLLKPKPQWDLPLSSRMAKTALCILTRTHQKAIYRVLINE